MNPLALLILGGDPQYGDLGAILLIVLIILLIKKL